jgi:hypothetical protein
MAPDQHTTCLVDVPRFARIPRGAAALAVSDMRLTAKKPKSYRPLVPWDLSKAPADKELLSVVGQLASADHQLPSVQHYPPPVDCQPQSFHCILPTHSGRPRRKKNIYISFLKYSPSQPKRGARRQGKPWVTATNVGKFCRHPWIVHGKFSGQCTNSYANLSAPPVAPRTATQTPGKTKKVAETANHADCTRCRGMSLRPPYNYMTAESAEALSMGHRQSNTTFAQGLTRTAGATRWMLGFHQSCLRTHRAVRPVSGVFLVTCFFFLVKVICGLSRGSAGERGTCVPMTSAACCPLGIYSSASDGRQPPSVEQWFWALPRLGVN